MNNTTGHRRSIRIRGYDYTQPGAYFVTICTHQRECHLGTVEDGQVLLSEAGHIVERGLCSLPGQFPGVDIDTFIVMPNHVHVIILISRGEAFSPDLGAELHSSRENASPLPRPRGTTSGSLGAVVQNFKSVSTRRINATREKRTRFGWQRNYYEHVIRSESALDRIRQYIQANPFAWEFDAENPKRASLPLEKVGVLLEQRCGFRHDELNLLLGALGAKHLP